MSDHANLASLEAATTADTFLHWARTLPVDVSLVTVARQAPAWGLRALEMIDPTPEELASPGPTALDWVIMCFHPAQDEATRQSRAQMVEFLAARTPVRHGPLHLACAVNFGAAVPVLSTAGHDLRGVNTDRLTPMEVAFESLSVDAALGLLKAGASRAWKGLGGTSLDDMLNLRARKSPEDRAAVELFEIDLSLRERAVTAEEPLPKGRQRM